MYQISIYYDEKLISTHNYNNALEAVHDFDLCQDRGFAKEKAVYNLLEPSGKLHTKVFNVNGLVAVR